jgi:hypothetical protein
MTSKHTAVVVRPQVAHDPRFFQSLISRRERFAREAALTMLIEAKETRKTFYRRPRY